MPLRRRRCGVNTAAEVAAIAKAIDAAPGLKFTGIQAYQGAMQHLERYEDRKAKLDAAIAQVEEAVEALKKEGLEPELVSGGGTGSYYFESCSWTPTMAGSSTKTGSASTGASGKMRSSS
jgi:3-hydroxy-D-aspartate aldolase